MLLLLQGFLLHNYYQLPLVPFASVLAGAGALAFGERLKSESSRRLALSGLAAVLALVSLFFGQDFVRSALQTDSRVVVNGLALGALVGPGRSLLVVDRHPQSVLYATDRRGFHRTEISMGELLDLERLGAEYLYVSKTSPSFAEAGFVALLLESRRLVAATNTWSLFELRPPRGGLDAAGAESGSEGDDDDSGGLGGEGDDDSAAEEAPEQDSVRSPSESLP